MCTWVQGNAAHRLYPSAVRRVIICTVALCVACGTELGADARFCRNCGLAAADTAFAEPTSQLGDAEIEKTLPTILQYSRLRRTSWYAAISGFVCVIGEFIHITGDTGGPAVPGLSALALFAILRK